MATDISHAQNLEKAQEFLLTPAGIGAGELEQVMGRILSSKLDYADLYF